MVIKYVPSNSDRVICRDRTPSLPAAAQSVELRDEKAINSNRAKFHRVVCCDRNPSPPVAACAEQQIKFRKYCK